MGLIFGVVPAKQAANTQLRSNIVVETDAPDAPDAEKMNMLCVNATWYKLDPIVGLRGYLKSQDRDAETVEIPLNPPF